MVNRDPLKKGVNFKDEVVTPTQEPFKVNPDGSVTQTPEDLKMFGKRVTSAQVMENLANPPILDEASRKANTFFMNNPQTRAMINAPQQQAPILQQQENQAQLKTMQEQQQAQGLVSQIGQINPTQPDILAKQSGALETPLAVGSGIVGGIGAGIVGGTKAGAVLGSAGGPAGTIIGAGIGLIAGASITLGKMSFDERQNVKNAKKLYSQSKTNIGQILTAVNKGQMSKAEAVIEFNRAKQDILIAEKHLKSENQGIAKYLSGGYEEMVEVELWKSLNMPILEQELAQGILNPDANKFYDFSEVALA